MFSPIQPKKKTDGEVVAHLRELKNTKLEELVREAYAVAQSHCKDLSDYPQLQTAEVLRAGYQEFKDEVLEEFKNSEAKSIAQMYLGAEGRRCFHSPSLEKKIEQELTPH